MFMMEFTYAPTWRMPRTRSRDNLELSRLPPEERTRLSLQVQPSYPHHGLQLTATVAEELSQIPKTPCPTDQQVPASLPRALPEAKQSSVKFAEPLEATAHRHPIRPSSRPQNAQVSEEDVGRRPRSRLLRRVNASP
jgi:hypothetical protein